VMVWFNLENYSVHPLMPSGFYNMINDNNWALPIRIIKKPDVMVHAYNHSAWEAEVGG
jgi:hypothetical protein